MTRTNASFYTENLVYSGFGNRVRSFKRKKGRKVCEGSDYFLVF